MHWHLLPSIPVEHLCYKCQASIDESLPFCPHCGAPQIRVASPEEEATPGEASAAGPPEARPEFVPPQGWAGSPPAYHPYAIQWDMAWKGAVLAGLIAAVLTATPLLSLGCCLWLLGAGTLAVSLYHRRVPGAVVTPGMGMRIGAVTGLIGFVATSIWSTFRFATNSQEFRSALEEQMQKSLANNPDPRAQDLMREFMSTLNTPQGLATFFVLSLVIVAVVFVVFGAAGGAVGASIFARRRNLR